MAESEEMRFLEVLGQRHSFFDGSSYFAAEALAQRNEAKTIISELGAPYGQKNEPPAASKEASASNSSPSLVKGFEMADVTGVVVQTFAPKEARTSGDVSRKFSAYLYNYKAGIRSNMAEDLMNFSVRRKEEHYIDKFRNQNALMKTFGEDGIKVYVVLDAKKSMGQMLQESGVPEDRFLEILEFMDKEGMVILENNVPETALLKPLSAQGAPKPQETKPVEPSVASMPRGAPIMAPSVSSGIQITPQSMSAEPPGAEEKQPKEEKLPPVPGIIRDEHTSTPIPPDYKKGKVLQPKLELQPEVQTEAEPEPELPKGIDITHAREEMERVVKDSEQPKPEDLLSPLERIIFDKFGQEGVDVYNLIDGEKTAEQILRETGVSESKLVEILEFMDGEGIIKLEKPGKPSGPQPGLPDAKELPFEPILDDREELPGQKKADQKDRGLSVMLPTPRPLGLIGKYETKLKLALRYRGKGGKLLAAVDGKKDTVQLSKELGIQLAEMDRIFVTLIKRNAVSLEQMTDDQLKDRYGSDGVKISRRYGREGVLIYELIGKEKTMKDVILRSGVEPRRAVDIVLFIHKTLDLGLPIDKRMLYAQLGIKEKPN